MSKLLLITILIPLYYFSVCNAYFRVCYYATPNNSSGPQVNEINATLCTHIIVIGSAVITNNSFVLNPDHEEHIKNVIALKKNHTNLKVMVTTGSGGNETGMHQICETRLNREKFIYSTLSILLKYGFDGLDIDWEFPSWDSPYPEDKDNFVELLHDLHLSFVRQSNVAENRRKLLLSVAVAGPFTIVQQSYNVTEMNKYVDFINLMTYDFHVFTKLWPFTGYNAPLYNRKSEKSIFQYLNTNFTAHFWHHLGMDKEKIIIGIPLYGYSFELSDENKHDVDAPAVKDAGDFTFPYICDFLKNESTHMVFDNEAKVPYVYNGKLWISYENVESVTFKAQYIKDNNFGGSMTFDLNVDDYTHKCDKSTRFVLNTVIYNILK